MPKLNLCTINQLTTYSNYSEQFKVQASVTNLELLNDADKKFYDYRKLNFQRSSRLLKTFELTEKTKQIFSNLNYKQKWIVITETWCGDSSQNLPVIAKLAQLSNNIDFKIVLRDSNLEFMDLYLTNGGRSIPKLIVFDENDNEIFQWGPRPVEAQNLFSELKKTSFELTAIHKALHLWYAKNRGKEVEKEIAALIKN